MKLFTCQAKNHIYMLFSSPKIFSKMGGNFSPRSLRIVSWIITSARVLKSWANREFFELPVFSSTSFWNMPLRSSRIKRAMLELEGTTRKTNFRRSKTENHDYVHVNEIGYPRKQTNAQVKSIENWQTHFTTNDTAYFYPVTQTMPQFEYTWMPFCWH